MKRKHLILLTSLSLFTFSALPGCGCGAVQTSEPIQTETATVEPETTSQSEDEAQEKTPQVPETTDEESVIEGEPVETAMEPTESVSQEIAITEMNETMYAVTNVNIRSEASADSDKLGVLSTGESIQVTGRTADEHWFRIGHPELGTGFVSSKYLSYEKPVIEQPASEEAAQQSQQTQDENLEPAPESTYQPPQSGGQIWADPNNQSSVNWGSYDGDMSMWDGVTGGTASTGQTTNPNTPAPGATPDNINGDMFGTPKDGSNFTENAGGILHAE